MKRFNRLLISVLILSLFTTLPFDATNAFEKSSSLIKTQTSTIITTQSNEKDFTCKDPVTFKLTKLSDTDLKKCEIPEYHKKDWAQRLQWFESKIINHYKGLNKKNILVVGPQKFLDAFKYAAKKHNWSANFTYSNTANSPEIVGGGQDLVIDAQYSSGNFKKIYGDLNVSSFKDVYAEILYDEALTFLEKNGVKFYFFEGPNAVKIKNLDSTDKKFLKIDVVDTILGRDRYNHKADVLKILYSDNSECFEYINEKYFGKYQIKNNGRHQVLCDCNSKLYNVLNGRRQTFSSINRDCKNSIYFYGPCIVGGAYTSDNYTIESYLQKFLNADMNNQYSVVNCGVNGVSYINDFEYILNTTFHPGDVVININFSDSTLMKTIKKHKLNRYETSHLFNRPHDYGYWMLNDGFHINHIGHKVIAKYIYSVIKPQLSNSEINLPPATVKYQFENEADTFLDDNPEFKKYLDGLKAIKTQTKATGKVGSIVMNCNPFTQGHRYLIERTAAQVDHLYIFVVEEDKSVFPFKDRLELVKKGTADLGDKVTVLPSGKWMISLLTFPEYFNKDDLQGAAIDPSKDINLFGKYIAPTLGINMRFVGEEPFDKVTRQYNETMKNILPGFGVSFYEIPRKTTDGKGDVISATKVRNALNAGDFETLKKYIPESTLSYLKENYEKIVKAIKDKYKNNS